MNPTELEAIRPYVERMMAETAAGKIKWTKNSPTSFMWVKTEAPRARLSIQKIVSRIFRTNVSPRVIETIDNYIFQATEIPSGNLRLAMNTQQDPEARELLRRLYDAISASTEQAAVDFLKELFGP
jgi:DNA-binding transcriptional MocR family regulator